MVPGWKRRGRALPGSGTALFREAVVANRFRGALPPVLFLAVCLVRAIVDAICVCE